MTTQRAAIDRRTLLKLMTAAGASTAGAHKHAAWASPAMAPVAGAQTGIDPFGFYVSDDELEDLTRRLYATRWPGDAPGEPWSYGTDRAYLEELVEYWRRRFDWRTHEAALNSFEHFTTTIEGQFIHFLLHRGRGPSPLPLVMTHGWPGTIWEMLPSVRALSDPAGYGGDADDSFDVVVPSIPGFGFSGEPIEGTNVVRTAECRHPRIRRAVNRCTCRCRYRPACQRPGPSYSRLLARRRRHHCR